MYINTKFIKAAIQCAASKDIRYYLMGVHIERTQGGDVHIVSTDGHVLFAGLIFDQHVQDAKPGPWRLTIPIDAAKQAAKAKTPGVQLTEMVEGRYMLGDTVFTPVDGVFPDWRRVVPSASDVDKREQSPSVINPSLLSRARDALVAWYGVGKDTVFALNQSGDSIAVMTGHDCTALVGIMPIRSDRIERVSHFTPAPYEIKE